jgi:hypothetical protein
MSKILIDEALRLADAIQLGWLENVDADKADIDMIQTELRRLHAENQALRQALSDSVEQPAQENSPWCMKMNGCKTKCEDCPDEVPKQPAPAQEPTELDVWKARALQAERTIEKFMTAPAQPLTDEQIEKLREKTFSTGNPYCPVDSKSMRKAARAIEAAHGIGEKK